LDVDVVGHQDVSVEPKAVAPAVVLDALEVALAVVLVVEGLLALVAAHDHVVEGAVKLDSGLSRHAGHRISKESRMSNKSILRPDPIPLRALDGVLRSPTI